MPCSLSPDSENPSPPGTFTVYLFFSGSQPPVPPHRKETHQQNTVAVMLLCLMSNSPFA